MENPFGKTPPAPKVAEKPEMAEMLGVPKAVFCREIDHEGRPTGEPVLVRVSPNGGIDLSGLEAKRRAMFEGGLPGRMGQGVVYPHDGMRFMEAIVRYASRRWHVSSPDDDSGV